ncbi:RPAP1-like protein [Paraphoma chrysanthemicola]|uniref:RPAP1-like protein n=1 Tax=Paraphoma chrysanthemicola TaxID=798071 RepID=A0A8K0RKM3_9PLEO|nr:RPAP1-like protein [Paraphoma chrysanthemicola]
MEFQRGERVNLNFDTGVVEKLESEDDGQAAIPTFPSFVGDILERDSSPASPPSAPSFKANVNGFPAHKKRTPRVSAFKQQRAAKEQQAAATSKAAGQNAPKATKAGFDVNQEKRSIEEENNRRLAAMSAEEIEEERQELLQGLSPALIQKLMARSNIDQGSNERDLFPAEPAAPPATDDAVTEPKTTASCTKKVSFAAPEPEHNTTSQQSDATQAATSHTTTQPTSEPTPETVQDSIHFPTPRQPPDLNPSDPNFLSALHEKYFPNLAYDPASLSWMQPIDPTDTSSPYHPSNTALNASELRFDFKGTLLAPSIARSIPTDRGLHHHAAAPEAAGYTIPELAILSRSAVAAQRCMAYQTLGRILYRLGQGEYGVEKARQDTQGPVQVARDPNLEDGEEEDDEEDVGSAMAAGLWACIEDGRVVETMTEEANRERGHLTARTYAQEALWNWRRGGGRKRQAV